MVCRTLIADKFRFHLAAIHERPEAVLVVHSDAHPQPHPLHLVDSHVCLDGPGRVRHGGEGVCDGGTLTVQFSRASRRVGYAMHVKGLSNINVAIASGALSRPCAYRSQYTSTFVSVALRYVNAHVPNEQSIALPFLQRSWSFEQVFCLSPAEDKNKSDKVLNAFWFHVYVYYVSKV